jgi:hypothetical protein
VSEFLQGEYVTAAIIVMLLAIGIIAIRREYHRFANDRRNYPYGWEPQPAQLASRSAPSQRIAARITPDYDDPMFDEDEEAVTKA